MPAPLAYTTNSLGGPLARANHSLILRSLCCAGLPVSSFIFPCTQGSTGACEYAALKQRLLAAIQSDLERDNSLDQDDEKVLSAEEARSVVARLAFQVGVGADFCFVSVHRTPRWRLS